MQTNYTKNSQDGETVAVVNESETKYVSSKDFFDMLRKEVNSHYDNL